MDDYILQCEEGLRQARELGDMTLQAHFLAELGQNYHANGSYKRGADCYEELLYITPSSASYKIALILEVLGSCRFKLKQFDEAIQCFERLLTYHRNTLEESNHLEVLGLLGWSHVLINKFDLGIQYLNSAFDLSKKIGDSQSQIRALDCLGFAYTQLQDFNKAIIYYRKVIPICHDLGNINQQTEHLYNLGICFLKISDTSNAKMTLEEASSMAKELGDKSLQERINWALLDIQAKQGPSIEAEKLLKDWHKQIHFGDSSWAVLHEAKGGMGNVLFVSKASGYPVACALKTIPLEFMHNFDRKQRFIQEARIWLEISNHPNIVKMDSIRESNGQMYLFIEMIIGPGHKESDLSLWCGIDRIGLNDCLKYAVGILDGLTYAHDVFEKQGISFAHLDLKPSNILISEDGNAKVTDFGISSLIYHKKETGVAQWSYPFSVDRPGTYPYMSPEQCSGDRSLDSRSDIYSFGCLLYEILTGEKLFKALDPQTYIYMHNKVTPDLSGITNSKFPPILTDIVSHCCEKAPENRYLTFTEIREKLAEVYNRQTGLSLPIPVSEKIGERQLYNKGLSFIVLDEYQKALEVFDELLVRAPADKRSLSQKAIVLRRLRRFEDAIESYEKAISIDPDYIYAIVGKALVLSEIDRNDEALILYDEAIQKSPSSFSAWNNKGNLLGHLGRFKEALDCHQTATDLKPGLMDALFGKCIDLFYLLELKSARTCFEEIEKLAPHNIRTKQLAELLNMEL